MVTRVEVAPLITWARERSRSRIEDLTRRFPQLPAWESGESRPTLKQLERYASVTHTPIGVFFLAEPPVEHVPLPDFRTIRDERLRRPSADLLDTIFLCEQRQEWYRDYARITGEDRVAAVGTFTTGVDVVDAATKMRRALQFGVETPAGTWTDSFRQLADRAEEQGVLVMVSGVVGANSHRKLDPSEFRGFALVDPYAPVVFVNGADTKAAQIFTLAHELAHIWLGAPALDNADLFEIGDREAVERWCNQVAAELLVPLDALRASYQAGQLAGELDRLARQFKVSTLVVLRRLHEAGFLTAAEYRQTYPSELVRLMDLLDARAGSGGNFYNSQPVRTSKRFTRAIIASTLEGTTLRRDAFRLLGFKNSSTFQELARRLGIA